jgi:hypothetical protein
MPDDEDTRREPTVEPTVAELLLARIESEVRVLRTELDDLSRVVLQLEPERSRECLVAIEAARSLLREVPDRARGR